MPTLEQIVVLSGVIFCIGLYGALSRRSVVTMLMSIELMFNGVNLAAVGFSRYILPAPLSIERLASNPGMAMGELLGSALTGQVFAMFIITVAAAEVALGLALVIAMYRVRETVDITELNLMSH